MRHLTPVSAVSSVRQTVELSPTPDVSPITKVLLTIEEAAAALSLGRTYTYHLVIRGDLLSVKVGRKRLVPAFALHEFVSRRVSAMQKGA